MQSNAKTCIYFPFLVFIFYNLFHICLFNIFILTFPNLSRDNVRETFIHFSNLLCGVAVLNSTILLCCYFVHCCT